MSCEHKKCHYWFGIDGSHPTVTKYCPDCSWEDQFHLLNGYAQEMYEKIQCKIYPEEIVHMIKEPPNLRESVSCIICEHSNGYWTDELRCTKYDKLLDAFQICDDFEREKK